MSLHHHQSLFSVQEEVLLSHNNRRYKYGLITHQVTLLLLLRYPWMHLHQAVLIALIHHEIKLSLWPEVQPHTLSLVAWHAAGKITDKPYNPQKHIFTGFLHHIQKLWWTRNTIRDPSYNHVIIDTKTCQETTYYHPLPRQIAFAKAFSITAWDIA